jgi:hypothetical protein
LSEDVSEDVSNSKWECKNCGVLNHKKIDCYYRPKHWAPKRPQPSFTTDPVVSVTHREEHPHPIGLNCDLVVSIDDPKFDFVFLEGFNEYLQQEKLKKENFAEFWKGKIEKAYKTGIC